MTELFTAVAIQNAFPEDFLGKFDDDTGRLRDRVNYILAHFLREGYVPKQTADDRDFNRGNPQYFKMHLVDIRSISPFPETTSSLVLVAARAGGQERSSLFFAEQELPNRKGIDLLAQREESDLVPGEEFSHEDDHLDDDSAEFHNVRPDSGYEAVMEPYQFMFDRDRRVIFDGVASKNFFHFPEELKTDEFVAVGVIDHMLSYGLEMKNLKGQWDNRLLFRVNPQQYVVMWKSNFKANQLQWKVAAGKWQVDARKGPCINVTWNTSAHNFASRKVIIRDGLLDETPSNLPDGFVSQQRWPLQLTRK